MSDRSTAARALAYAFVAASLAIHGVIAWISPLQGDDWGHWRWAKVNEHESGLTWLIDLVSKHFTFSDLTGFALARSELLHAVLTPLVGIALVWGLFTIAARRLPRTDSWDDVLAIVALAAFVWISTPAGALPWFHRPYVAVWIYGAALALWFLAPYRCRWQPRGAWVPLLFVAGWAAGSSSRQVGTAALIAVVYAMRTTPGPRPRWMWTGLAGVAIGTISGYLDTPYVDFKGFRSSFEGSLFGIAISLREACELIALLLGLAVLKLLAARLRPAWSGSTGAPDSSESLRWLWAWFGLAVLALFGPRYSEATLFPVALVLVIAAYPYFVWLATSRPLRVVIAAIAIGTHLIVWIFALRTYIPAAAEGQARIAKLEATPVGGVATIDPYTSALPSFWFFGEDLSDASSRQLIAIELFGLRDIELSSRIGRAEPNAHLKIELAIEGVTPEQLVEARAPAYWATEVASARGQFDGLIEKLENLTTTPFSARLVVTSLPLDVLRGRPLLVAAYDQGDRMKLRTARSRPDETNTQGVAVRPGAFVTTHPEAYSIIGTRTSPARLKAGRYQLQPMTTELHGVVACDPVRCFLVDAFVPLL